MLSFFDNAKYSLYGVSYKFIVSVISVAIYIRIIGVPGFALVGIVKSLLNIMYNLNCPYFLSLLKKKDQQAYSTLLNSVFISNILIIMLGIPIAQFLSYNVYQDGSLVPLFFMGALAFTANRIVMFLVEFLRTCSSEDVVMKSSIIGKSVELISTILLMWWGFGVPSIFIGMLIGAIVSATILFKAANMIIKYHMYFSFSLLGRYLVKYIGPNYVHQVSSTASFWIGFFISSFFLDIQELGILSIFISIAQSLKMFMAPLSYHLAPIFLKFKIRDKIRTLFLAFQGAAFLCVFALVAFGEPFYYIYFSSGMNGTYPLFLIFASVQIYSFVHIISGSYLFVKNIRVLIFLHIFLAVLLGSLSWAWSSYGMLGAVAAYCVVLVIKTIFHYFVIAKLSSFSKKDIMMIAVSLMPALIVWTSINATIGFLSFVVVVSLLYFVFKTEFVQIKKALARI